MSNRLIPSNSTQDRAVYLCLVIITAAIAGLAILEACSINHCAKLPRWAEITGASISVLLWTGLLIFTTFLCLTQYDPGDDPALEDPRLWFWVSSIALALFVTGYFWPPMMLAYQVATVLAAVAAVGYLVWEFFLG